MTVEVFGKPGAGCPAKVQTDVHSLRRKGALAQIHRQFHEPPEVGAVRGSVGIDGGLRFSKCHQQVTVGVRVPVQENHATGIAVNDVLFGIALRMRPVVRQEIWTSGGWRRLGRVGL